MTYRRDATVHGLFEKQAQQTPEAPALVLPSLASGSVRRTMTYRQLDDQAGRLSARLRVMGVRPGELVAVLADRSIEMGVALLAILKAGAAYVPLDPSYPQERLDFMMADTRATVVLTQPQLQDRARSSGASVHVMDDNTDRTPNTLTSRHSEPRAADTAAYVIYTSGSTGRPKGVVVPHRGIVRLVTGTSYARLDTTRVILQLAPPSFDAATFEIWGALLHGARCVLYPDTGAPDLDQLRQVIVGTGITTMWLTASLFNTIVDHAPATLETVEEVLVGGEALSVSHIRRALDLLPNTQLVNGYGPTESTTFACCYRIPRQVPPGARSIPIGPPIANTSVFLLDADRRPVLAGEPGDLYIGGDGLAIGYLNQPELTAERFVSSPFAGAGTRLYHTGDRARALPDGALEFLGRRDEQVKIRGYRVELGEVEAALREHTGVGDAVAVVREDGPGDKRLVAYYTDKGREGVSPLASLRDHLNARLPEYMVPSRFVRVDSIPLTPNGKADRRALPEPGRQRPELDRPMVAPRTAVEEWVAGHWRELLGLDDVGVNDRFFELGGTSLTAMRLLDRLSRESGRPLPALLLFRAPTVATMAAILEAEHQGALPASVAAGMTAVPAGAAGILAERAAQRREELRERRLRRRQAR